MKPNQIDFFDEHSKTDWWSTKHPFWVLSLFNKLRVPFICNAIKRNMSKEVSQCTILDVGCGAGFLSEALALKGAYVLGLDTSSRCLQVARDHQKAQQEAMKQSHLPLSLKPFNLEYRHGDISTLQGTSTCFDVVVASEVVEHVAHPTKFLQDCSKMIHPGGLLIVTTPNRNFFSYLAMIFFAESLLKLLPKKTHCYSNFIKPKELLSICEKECGLQSRQYSGALYLPWPFQRWFREPFGCVSYMMSFQKPKN